MAATLSKSVQIWWFPVRRVLLLTVTKKCPHYYFHKKNSKEERPQFQSSVAGHPEEQCNCDDDDSVHEGEDTDGGVNKKIW